MPTPIPSLARWSLPLLAVVLLLPACAGTADVAVGDGSSTASPAEGSEPARVEPEPTTPAPTAPADSGGNSVTVSGVLGGSSMEGGCVWLDADDGTRYELIAGPDSAVAIDPANQVVADASGAVIAESGDEITATGTVDSGLMTFCQVGENLVVATISAG